MAISISTLPWSIWLNSISIIALILFVTIRFIVKKEKPRVHLTSIGVISLIFWVAFNLAYRVN